MRIPLTVGLAVLLTACGSVRPIAIHSGDVCYRCRRVIEHPKLGAEIVDMSGHAYKFRTAGCMAKYLAEHSEETRGVFVTDQATGRLIGAEHASFVNVEIDERTRERDYLAFGQAAEAPKAASTYQTSPISWQQVVGRARQTGD